MTSFCANAYMTPDQEIAAFRDAINTMNTALQKQGQVRPTRGLLDNLTVLAPAMSEGAKAYNKSKHEAELDNMITADEYYAYKKYKNCKDSHQYFKGCCSHHGGVMGCIDYKVYCNDETYSPTCRCTVSDCVAY